MSGDVGGAVPARRTEKTSSWSHSLTQPCHGPGRRSTKGPDRNRCRRTVRTRPGSGRCTRRPHAALAPGGRSRTLGVRHAPVPEPPAPGSPGMTLMTSPGIMPPVSVHQPCRSGGSGRPTSVSSASRSLGSPGSNSSVAVVEACEPSQLTIRCQVYSCEAGILVPSLVRSPDETDSPLAGGPRTGPSSEARPTHRAVSASRHNSAAA